MKYKITKINKVIVALSGGVDSSVTIWILKQIGFYIECVFIKCWEEDDKKNFCNSKKDYKDSKKICKYLNVKLHKINFSLEYWNKVFKIFIKEQKKNKTLNPDILCNKKIKFGLFIKLSIKILKANYISTGHYVNKIRKKKIYLLYKGIDKIKDQSYFLYNLNQKQIKKCIFPLGNYYKKNIRKIASNLNLINSKKKDSMGICFIGKKNFKFFIKKYIKNNPGKIVNINNETIGLHKGLFYYTIGQRKNLNIKKKRSTKPYYVIKKDKKKNKLIVVEGKKNILLYYKGLYIKKIHFIHIKKKINYLICKIKTRHQQKETSCKIFFKKKIKVIFSKPIYAITPGQSAVFYKKNICLGGGIIIKGIPINNNKKNQ